MAEPSTERKPRGGVRITKETARQYSLSAAAAKRRRKEARMKILAALTAEDVDLGVELMAALRAHDGDQISNIEKALKIAGMHHDQSDEALAQRFEVNSKSEVKSDNTLRVTIEEVGPGHQA